MYFGVDFLFPELPDEGHVRLSRDPLCRVQSRDGDLAFLNGALLKKTHEQRCCTILPPFPEEWLRLARRGLRETESYESGKRFIWGEAIGYIRSPSFGLASSPFTHTKNRSCVRICLTDYVHYHCHQDHSQFVHSTPTVS